MNIRTISRRQFVQSAAPLAISASALGRASANAASERIAVGVIGCGSRGFNLIDALLPKASAQIVAVCDVDAFHYRDRPWGKGPANGRGAAKKHVERFYAKKSGKSSHRIDAYRDFRELTQRDDIDAVVVATPDHWHALCVLDALSHGKDVYCEKPVTHLLREGQIINREVAARGAIFQTGSQQRSSWEFRRAVQLARGGYLGDVTSVEVGLPSGYSKPQGETTEREPPESLDYELWCGPAPKLNYMRARHHRWWRGSRAYGGGVLMDWIGHHNDIAHWALGMDRSGPNRVHAVGWEMPETEVYDTPWHYEIQCDYASGVKTSIGDRHKVGTKIIGSEGWVFVTRGKIVASDPRWTAKSFQPKAEGIYHCDDHMQNFLDGVTSRSECICPSETAHRSITPGHLGYVSHELGRPLNWDPIKEQFIGNNQANELLYKIDYRKPWTLLK